MLQKKLFIKKDKVFFINQIVKRKSYVIKLIT